MRILITHADFIEFQPLTKAIKTAEEVPLDRKRVEECLVVFTSVEEGDTEAVAEEAKKEIANIARQVKADKLVIYPFVHLSSKPAKPDVALNFLKSMEKIEGYNVTRAPFGWYKMFNVQVKGHPLSELSRTFNPAIKGPEKEVVSASLKAEAELTSKFYIFTPDGQVTDIDKFDFTGKENLRKLVDYEVKKSRVYQQEPPHIKIMKSHRIVDYEPASDPGHFRWLPAGIVIKHTLEKLITDWCVGMGALQVETPIMYDNAHPALSSYLNRFPARRYVVESEGKQLFLRFSACFGQFLALHDAVITYHHLPLKIYELTHYSFRREQSGELAGLKRLRAFTMPDMHTLCATIAAAKKEFMVQYEKSLEWNKTVGLDTELAFRAEREFFETHKEWYAELIKTLNKPAMIEIFDTRYAYFITKFECNFIDNMGKASALSTVQIDVENAETYDINYVTKDGSKKKPIILHASLSGSIDRVIYALLENEAAKMARSEIPMFPLFLSPIQARVIPFSPLSKEHMKAAKAILRKFQKGNVRIDVDDRNETIGKKIRDAETEWIPYVIVIGDKELKEGKISVRVRGKKEVELTDAKTLLKQIASQIKNYPSEPLSLPAYLTKRPLI
jgi:threonyl-tRNA synthetase